MANHSIRHKTYPLLKEGKTVAEVCETTGAEKGTVLRHARELKLISQERLTPRYDWTEVQKAYDAGMTPSRCMEKFGFCSTAWMRAEQTGKLKTDPVRRRKRGPLNEDLTGKRFGLLTVVRLQPTPSKRMGSGRHWVCKCDCGTEAIVTTANLNHGENRSCGCSRKRQGDQSSHWKGHGQLGFAYWGAIQHGALKRARGPIEFNITIEYAWSLFLEQDEKCALSGQEISLLGGRKSKRTASLDRIDSSKGYIEGNVQWVHKWVNLMKLDHPQEEFLDWVKLIHNHNFPHESTSTNSRDRAPSLSAEQADRAIA